MTAMKRFLHILFFAFVSVGLSAQTLPSLLVSADGAVAGTGGLAVAARPGAWSLENNAAMLPFQDGRLAAAVTYGMWQPAFANDKVLGAGVSFKASDRLSFGLTARNFAMPEYTVVNELGAESQVNGTFSPKESTIGLGGAFALSDHFSVGVSAKMTSSSLAKDAKASVFGADVSLAYSQDALRAGFSVCNLGGGADYGSGSHAQPTLARAGVSYGLGDASASAVTLGAEADYLFSGGLMAGVGAEYAFKQLAFVRAGFHYGDAAKAVPTYASLGLGVHVAGLVFDAAYLLASETVGGSLCITLGYSF